MNKTIRDKIQENIVEDFELYKLIFNDFNNLVKLMKEEYIPLSFDNFCIKLLNYIDGIDEKKELTNHEYHEIMYQSLMLIFYEEIQDIELINNFNEIMKKEELKI